MSLYSTWMLGRLLYDVTSGKRGPRAGIVEERISGTWEKHPSILYEPRPPARPRGTIVLVHGVTAQGSDDPLLAHLARCVTSLGYRCVTPSLAEIASFHHSATDIDTLVDAIVHASELTGGRVSVMSFSYGAAYALRAAADSRCRGRLHHVLCFGAYYLLQEALEHQRSMLLAAPRPDNDSTDLAYLRYTLLVCHREQLDISEEGWASIDKVLDTFTAPGSPETKRAPLLKYARDIDYVALMDSYRARDLSDRLSPAGTLQDIDCRVSLLHDPLDRFVPAHHVERIRADLDKRATLEPTRTLTTPMFSHVQVAPMRSMVHVPELLGILRPVFWL